MAVTALSSSLRSLAPYRPTIKWPLYSSFFTPPLAPPESTRHLTDSNGLQRWTLRFKHREFEPPPPRLVTLRYPLPYHGVYTTVSQSPDLAILYPGVPPTVSPSPTIFPRLLALCFNEPSLSYTHCRTRPTATSSSSSATRLALWLVPSTRLACRLASPGPVCPRAVTLPSTRPDTRRDSCSSSRPSSSRYRTRVI